MGKSHEIVIKMLRVEKVGAHAAFWENLWAKAGPNRARSTHQKRGLRWITNWQFYWSRSYVLSLKITSQYETYTWGYTWRPLACYPIINTKLAAYHLLLYVVYLCQKSWNFFYALICYKQKCKVVSLNLAHPVVCQFFANSYLNLFVTKRCKNFTFADQVFFTVWNWINVQEIVQQLELKL